MSTSPYNTDEETSKALSERVDFSHAEAIHPSGAVRTRRVSRLDARKEAAAKRYRKTGLFEPSDFSEASKTATDTVTSSEAESRHETGKSSDVTSELGNQLKKAGRNVLQDAPEAGTTSPSTDASKSPVPWKIRKVSPEAKDAEKSPMKAAPEDDQRYAVFTRSGSPQNEPAKRPSFLSRLVGRVNRVFTRKDDDANEKPDKRKGKSKKHRDVIGKHVLDPKLLHNASVEVATQIPSYTNIPTITSDPEEQTDGEYTSEDSDTDTKGNMRIKSFIQLLGVHALVPYRNALELYTDRERLNAERKLGASSKLNNAAILEDMDLDHIEDYDDEFLKIWDLEVGAEMIEYMEEQTEAYRTETAQLQEENAHLEEEVMGLRRKRQDAYFRIKDLEIEAAEAERRYAQLHRIRPSRKALEGLHLSRKKMVIVATLQAQREELLRQYREVHRDLNVGVNSHAKDEYEIDKDLNLAQQTLEDAKKNFEQTERNATLRKNDLALIQQELNYLKEELGLYVFEDDKAHPDMTLSDAVAHLAMNNGGGDKACNQTKRLTNLEESLATLKKTGFDQMKKVNDAHEEVAWHVSRREDILSNLVRKYMHDKNILKLDRKILRVLRNQRQNIPLLETQIEEQSAIAAEMEPKWLAIKEDNGLLRDIIVNLSNSKNMRRDRGKAPGRRESLEMMCANVDTTEYEDDQENSEIAHDTWGSSTDEQEEMSAEENHTAGGEPTETSWQTRTSSPGDTSE